MTDTLQWRDADELRLHAPVIPQPTNPSQTTNALSSVRVAFDNGFIHIDPRPTNGQASVDKKAEYPVYVVPASAVEVLTYRVVPKASTMVGFG